MGFMDKFKGKAEDAVGEHGDKIDSGLDKTAEVADEKTGGEHSDKIDQGVDKARDGLDSLGGQDSSNN
ncbi:MAG: antitoxin [Streptomyces sp.]